MLLRGIHHAAGQPPVDLQYVHREAGQVVQAAVPRPEVVQRDAQPGLLQPHGNVLDLVEGLDEHRLSDLQRDDIRLHAAFPDRLQDAVRAVFHHEVLYRKVDPHP